MSDEDILLRRNVLGAAAVTTGAAAALGGAATEALLNDEESFLNNTLVSGKLDLLVGWRADYYHDLTSNPRTLTESALGDDPGPLVELDDLKPGDVISKILRFRITGNPGFVYANGLIRSSEDDGITEPEDAADGTPGDGSDGTSGGDIEDHLRCVIWLDGDSTDSGASDPPGDGLPDEVLNDPIEDRQAFLQNLVSGSVTFDTTSEQFVFGGTLSELLATAASDRGLLLGPDEDNAENQPSEHCFAPDVTHALGCLCWLPADVPGIDDNLLQSDRLTYTVGFNAVQCRHNVAERDSTQLEEFRSTLVGGEPEEVVDRSDTVIDALDERRDFDAGLKTAAQSVGVTGGDPTVEQSRQQMLELLSELDKRRTELALALVGLHQGAENRSEIVEKVDEIINLRSNASEFSTQVREVLVETDAPPQISIRAANKIVIPTGSSVDETVRLRNVGGSRADVTIDTISTVPDVSISPSAVSSLPPGEETSIDLRSGTTGSGDIDMHAIQVVVSLDSGGGDGVVMFVEIQGTLGFMRDAIEQIEELIERLSTAQTTTNNDRVRYLKTKLGGSANTLADLIRRAENDDVTLETLDSELSTTVTELTDLKERTNVSEVDVYNTSIRVDIENLIQILNRAGQSTSF